MKLRPRFSLRTLLLLPALVGLFYLFGQFTRNHGTPQVNTWLKENRSGGKAIYEGPFLFSQASLSMAPKSRTVTQTNERYFLWLGGPVFELPFQRNYTDTIGPGVSLNDIAEKRLLKQASQ